MRYYSLRVTDPATGFLAKPNYNSVPGFSWIPDDGSSTYGSLNAGASAQTPGGTNMNALQVDLDIHSGYFHTPESGTSSYINIHGIGLKEISQASNLNLMNCTLDVGMAAGLPLSNPAQIGRAVSGMVLQCLGNWMPGQQTLTFFIGTLGASPTSNQTTGKPISNSTTPLPAINATPANIVFQWQPGQPLLAALVPALQTAFPKYSIRGAVNPGLVWSGAPSAGYFNAIDQLASFLNARSLSMLQGFAPPPFAQAYPGVMMSINPASNTILITDGSTPTKPVSIQFLDLVGQPTWIGQFVMQFQCAMRGDIQCGDFVTLPPVLGTIEQGSNSQWSGLGAAGPQLQQQLQQPQNVSAFQGTMMVRHVRHVGSSREDSGGAWISAFDCQMAPWASAATSTSPGELPLLASPNQSYKFYMPT